MIEYAYVMTSAYCLSINIGAKHYETRVKKFIYFKTQATISCIARNMFLTHTLACFDTKNHHT